MIPFDSPNPGPVRHAMVRRLRPFVLDGLSQMTLPDQDRDELLWRVAHGWLMVWLDASDADLGPMVVAGVSLTASAEDPPTALVRVATANVGLHWAAGAWWYLPDPLMDDDLAVTDG